MLRDVLIRVGSEFQEARKESFAAHPLASFIRETVCSEIKAVLDAETPGFQFKGSPGQGNWATVPWLAVFDPVVTTSAERGYYVVYLFHSTDPVAFLSLNQGTTAVRKEFGRLTRDVLADRASTLRRRIPEFVQGYSTAPIELGSSKTLPRDYEAGHVFGRRYDLSRNLGEQDLRSDLRHMIRAYLALTFRGGLEPSAETHDEDDHESDARGGSVIETRRYRLHRRIERSSNAGKEAKKHHGTQCKACGLEFVEMYGALGDGYIEAHHLRPLSTLEEGVPIELDPVKDLTVLCANCHRMIHRLDDPSDLEGLRNRIR